LKLLHCATGNQGKLREFRLAASANPVSIDLLPGFRQMPACVEDGDTFEANAILKARHYFSYAEPPVALLFADDSGLEVDALGGAPGVLSARFSGPHATDEANNRLLLERLDGIAHRSARFVCAVALVEGGILRGVYRGAVEGQILEGPRGTAGFGYDPLFFCPELGCTFSEASDDAKFAVSHRGQALRAMLAAL
jgi:XTP/dITP diphosphohydrolase